MSTLPNPVTAELVTAARRSIEAAGPRHDVLLPSSVLVRMFYELRRHALVLAQALDARAQAATAVAADGSASLAPADLVTVLGALADAEAFCQERAATYCLACVDHPAGACETHLDDLDQAAAYRSAAARLGGES